MTVNFGALYTGREDGEEPDMHVIPGNNQGEVEVLTIITGDVVNSMDLYTGSTCTSEKKHSRGVKSTPKIGIFPVSAIRYDLHRMVHLRMEVLYPQHPMLIIKDGFDMNTLIFRTVDGTIHQTRQHIGYHMPIHLHGQVPGNIIQ